MLRSNRCSAIRSVRASPISRNSQPRTIARAIASNCSSEVRCAAERPKSIAELGSHSLLKRAERCPFSSRWISSRRPFSTSLVSPAALDLPRLGSWAGEPQAQKQIIIHMHICNSIAHPMWSLLQIMSWYLLLLSVAQRRLNRFLLQSRDDLQRCLTRQLARVAEVPGRAIEARRLVSAPDRWGHRRLRGDREPVAGAGPCQPPALRSEERRVGEEGRG